MVTGIAREPGRGNLDLYRLYGSRPVRSALGQLHAVPPRSQAAGRIGYRVGHVRLCGPVRGRLGRDRRRQYARDLRAYQRPLPPHSRPRLVAGACIRCSRTARPVVGHFELGETRPIDLRTRTVLPAGDPGLCDPRRPGRQSLVRIRPGLDQTGPRRQMSLIPLRFPSPIRHSSHGSGPYVIPPASSGCRTARGLFRFDPHTEKSTRYSTNEGLPVESILCHASRW